MTTHDYELGYKQKLAKLKEKNVEGNYYSTYDFVNQTKLSRLATKVLGKGWEAEDDVNQIQEIVNSLSNGKYSVVCSYPTAFKEDIIVTKISDKSNKDIDKAFTQLISLYDICDELEVYGDYKASKIMRDKLNKIGKFIQSLKN